MARVRYIKYRYVEVKKYIHAHKKNTFRWSWTDFRGLRLSGEVESVLRFPFLGDELVFLVGFDVDATELFRFTSLSEDFEQDWMEFSCLCFTFFGL